MWAVSFSFFFIFFSKRLNYPPPVFSFEYKYLLGRKKIINKRKRLYMLQSDLHSVPLSLEKWSRKHFSKH